MADDQITLFRRTRIGFIFQFFNLLPTLSALENVTLPFVLDGPLVEGMAPGSTLVVHTTGSPRTAQSVAARFPLYETAAAHQEVERGGKIGTVVVEPQR